jgi:hypothetical protein
LSKVEEFSPSDYAGFSGAPQEPARPVNWNLLTAVEAEAEWRDLDRWVKWLKNTFGLPPAIVPPLWHRHDELIWELSALHTHFLNCYDPDASPSAPIGWLRDFADARNRLRDWVSTCGTRLDRDRSSRITTWPGETPLTPAPETPIVDRDQDFEDFVRADLAARRQIEATVFELIGRRWPLHGPS